MPVSHKTISPNRPLNVTIIIQYHKDNHLFVFENGTKATDVNMLPNLCKEILQAGQRDKIKVYINSEVKLKDSFSDNLIKLFKKNDIEIQSFIVPVCEEPGKINLVEENKD
jgi:hypothetical protein